MKRVGSNIEPNNIEPRMALMQESVGVKVLYDKAVILRDQNGNALTRWKDTKSDFWGLKVMIELKLSYVRGWSDKVC